MHLGGLVDRTTALRCKLYRIG